MRFSKISIGLIAVVVAALAGIRFFVLPRVAKVAQEPPEESLLYQSFDPNFQATSFVLNEVLEANTNDIYYGYLFWQEEDGYSLPLRGYSGGVVSAVVRPGESVEDIVAFVNARLLEEGYQKDARNTDVTDNGFDTTHRYGYRKGDTLCRISTTDTFHSDIEVFCGAITEQDRMYHQEFFNTLNPLARTDAVFVVDIVHGDYARGSKGSGFAWYAKKENGVWRELFEAQEELFCDQVDEYAIPVEVYRNCLVSKEGQTRF
ncbi:MAG: hypothetical protein AAB671_01310 [Patescibacteria group bacterium]